MFDPREDASLAPLENKVTGNAPTMVRYLRSTLGYESDLYYIGPFGGAWPPNDRFRGDWMTMRWNRSEAPEAPLRDVLAANPSLRVLHASGAYDLVTPAGPPAYMIEGLEPELRDRFTVRVYEGGHSFYLDRASRLQFMRDGAALIDSATRAQIGAVALFPQTLNRFLLYFFYRWETCVREATILGLLGILSLGFWVTQARAATRYDEMVFYIALGAALVLAGDLISAAARAVVRRS